MNEINEYTLEFMKNLKQLLINYISVTYEENADFSINSLIKEYYLLERNNNLHYLFEVEYLISSVRLELEYGLQNN
ncbi:hypothetical protein [Polaribacter aestuariivivens]|uniref:hypothetical protein n=1 Tax=Polaribacter aestuariivivens TaxID=2304626 RepID=UPI003F49318A